MTDCTKNRRKGRGAEGKAEGKANGDKKQKTKMGVQQLLGFWELMNCPSSLSFLPPFPGHKKIPKNGERMNLTEL
jgi:hypothetical protein